MSQHSDEFLVASDSFWEPGNYKRTTRRIDDGNKLCSDLMMLITERAEIEKAYAKQLKAWALKWNGTIEKGPEYGTTEAAWKAVLVEADRRCDLHTRVRDDLTTKVNGQLKQWQKDAYHKSMMQLKEKKEMDDAFKKAQKPWAKLLTKVNKAKADYHNACKAEKTAINLERNATGDSTISQDQLRKLSDRVQKCKETVVRSRDNYELSLQDINNYNAKYMEDMTEVFERCQRMEAQRLQCFKDTLFQVQKCLNVAEDPVLPQIYEEFSHTVHNADHEKDLRWWSNTYGVNMPMNWPQFEDYTEEFREITGKSVKGKSSSIADGTITLINQRPVGDDLPEATNAAPRSNGSSSSTTTSSTVQHRSSVVAGSNGATHKVSTASQQSVNARQPASNVVKTTAQIRESTLNPFESDSDDEESKDATEDRPETEEAKTEATVGSNNDDAVKTELAADAKDDAKTAVTMEVNGQKNVDEAKKNETNGGGGSTANPFPDDDEEWDDALVDHGEPGVKVRALYDYEAMEDDELHFKTGDIFEKLEDEDEQGWCKGRKDGVVGLYPANYVEVV